MTLACFVAPCIWDFSRNLGSTAPKYLRELKNSYDSGCRNQCLRGSSSLPVSGLTQRLITHTSRAIHTGDWYKQPREQRIYPSYTENGSRSYCVAGRYALTVALLEHKAKVPDSSPALAYAARGDGDTQGYLNARARGPVRRKCGAL